MIIWNSFFNILCQVQELRENSKIYVNKEKLEYIFEAKGTKRATILGRKFLDAVFTKEALTVCFLRGGESKSSKEGESRPGPDKNRMDTTIS